MDFKQLESFISIAKYKSFSKAAKELFLTQPTITNHIQNLEKELGTILINRSNRTISLTKAGDILYDYALDMINTKKKTMFTLGEYKGKIEGLIEIASSTIPEEFIVPEIIKSFSKEFPHVKYTLKHFDSSDVIDEILNQKANFGFVGARISNSQIEYVNIADDELILIAPCDIEIKNDDGVIDIKDIKNIPLIMRETGSGTRDLFMKELEKNKLALDNFNVIAHIENTESIKQMVRKGMGVSIISRAAVKDEEAFGLLKIYKIKSLKLKRNFYFAYPKKRTLAPLEEKFKEHVIESMNL